MEQRCTGETYVYGDSDWKDLLTSYDGHPITYDGIGNPTVWYDGSSMTWTKGRRLASKGNITFTYDAEGHRLTKTANGVEHKYLWQGDRLISEQYGGTGDVWAEYTYDAWGKVLTATGNLAAANPLRYRGYFYDEETGLYYIHNRYYDPQLCRWINADDKYLVTGQGFIGCNVFAYCLNNSVNKLDVKGNDTCGIGIDISVAFGLRAGVTAQIVVDDNHNLGLVITFAVGGGTPAASISAVESYTNADTIYDLKGFGGSLGGSAIVGGELSFGNARNGENVFGLQLSATIVSAPVPVEVHGEVTYSLVYSLDSLPALLKFILYKLVMNQNKLFN